MSLFSFERRHDIDANNYVLLDVWIYFQLIPNTVLLPLLVATFLFSKRVKRHATVINVCVTWIFSGIFSLLLYYAGQDRGVEVDKGLCITQTSLLYGITPMWAVAVAVMIHYMIAAVNGTAEVNKTGRARMMLMLSAPYIVEIVFAIATFSVSAAHPDRVDRDTRVLYCALHSRSLSLARIIITFIFCLVIIGYEVRLAMIMYRNWRGVHMAGRSNNVGIGLFIRVLVFGVFIFLGMIANLIVLFKPESHVPDIYAAIMGSVIFLIFGTQEDVLSVWCFWRRTKRPPKGPIQVAVSSFSESDSIFGDTSHKSPTLLMEKGEHSFEPGEKKRKAVPPPIQVPQKPSPAFTRLN